jgi:hypothetical protein
LKKLTATRVAQHLDISVPTLTNWYRWYNNPDYDKPSNVPELPKYEQNGKRATRYWKEEDLPKLIKFRDWVPKGRAGIMGEHNAQFWGDRGKRALKNKKMKDGLQKS